MNYGNLNIGLFLKQSSHRYPEKEALVTEKGRFTYREFDGQVNQLCNGLLDMGIKKGDRVAFLFYNEWEALASYFAITRIGAVVVPINYRLVKDEMLYQLNHSESRAFIFDPTFGSQVQDMMKDAPKIENYLCSEGKGPAGNCQSLDELFLRYPTHDPKLRWKVREQDPSGILYTSGTTGRPKGAVITHYSAIWSAVTFALENQFAAGMRFLECVPLFHRAGLEDLALPVIMVGGTILLLRTFDAMRVLKTIEKEKATHAFIVPTMSYAVLQELEAHPGKYDVSRLDGYLTGTAPWPGETMRRLRAHFPATTRQANLFGITEALFITAARQEELDRKGATAGKPVIGAQMKILDDRLQEAPPGVVGEIVVKEPQQMKGYWKNPQATKEVTWKDGWYRSGDLGYVDEEGYLYILDRKKDMIISGSENVYSVEVENVLVTHPQVAEAGVIGTPDEKWGEVVTACVVLKPGQKAEAREVIEFCDGRMASYKKPKRVFFVESLPKSPTGKIQKVKLREQFKNSR